VSAVLVSASCASDDSQDAGGTDASSSPTPTTIATAFLDLHVAGTASPDEFDDLTASLEPGMWTDAGS
jgi:hypothetical protein